MIGEGGIGRKGGCKGKTLNVQSRPRSRSSAARTRYDCLTARDAPCAVFLAVFVRCFDLLLLPPSP